MAKLSDFEEKEMSNEDGSPRPHEVRGRFEAQGSDSEIALEALIETNLGELLEAEDDAPDEI